MYSLLPLLAELSFFRALGRIPWWERCRARPVWCLEPLFLLGFCALITVGVVTNYLPEALRLVAGQVFAYWIPIIWACFRFNRL